MAEDFWDAQEGVESQEGVDMEAAKLEALLKKQRQALKRLLKGAERNDQQQEDNAGV